MVLVSHNGHNDFIVILMMAVLFVVCSEHWRVHIEAGAEGPPSEVLISVMSCCVSDSDQLRPFRPFLCLNEVILTVRGKKKALNRSVI